MWGGAGADTFVFAEGMYGGIAVVSIPGLTEEMFATLPLASLTRRPTLADRLAA